MKLTHYGIKSYEIYPPWVDIALNWGNKFMGINVIDAILHKPGSEWERKRANEGAQRSTRAEREVRSKQVREWCKQTSEWTSELPNSNIPISRVLSHCVVPMRVFLAKHDAQKP